MAFESTGAAVITATMVDWNNNKSTVEVHAPDSVVGEDVNTWATGGFVTHLEALSDAVVTNISVQQGFRNADAPAAPSSSNIERKGSFVFRDENNGTMTVQIPSIKQSLVLQGTNYLEGTAVTNFVNAVVDGGIWDLVGLVTKKGEKLTGTTRRPRVIHRANSKG